MRNYNLADRLLANVDQALRTVFGIPLGTGRSNPAEGLAERELSESTRRHSIRLMRVNHTGEVCAQALYQGQSLTARRNEVRVQMDRSAREENDHLAWCSERLTELGGHTSYLNPMWYAGSFVIGSVSGLIGDRWSLGFLAETEHQVVRHLEGHLQRLPEIDQKSRAIIVQMKADEAGHETAALGAGAAELPRPIPRLMTLASKVMTTVAARI
jgi:ubiquinone biosynthesis monooxygenase Coq7